MSDIGLLQKSLFCTISCDVMSDIFKTFRDNVRSLLRRPGWSQETLGKKTGYGQSYVSALLRGDKRFNEDTIKSFRRSPGN